MHHIQNAIEQYLDAVEKVHGPEYRKQTEVSFGGGHYVRIRQPDTIEGEVVPVGHLELMTQKLLDEGRLLRKAA